MEMRPYNSDEGRERWYSVLRVRPPLMVIVAAASVYLLATRGLEGTGRDIVRSLHAVNDLITSPRARQEMVNGIWPPKSAKLYEGDGSEVIVNWAKSSVGKSFLQDLNIKSDIQAPPPGDFINILCFTHVKLMWLTKNPEYQQKLSKKLRDSKNPILNGLDLTKGPETLVSQIFKKTGKNSNNKEFIEATQDLFGAVLWVNIREDIKQFSQPSHAPH